MNPSQSKQTKVLEAWTGALIFILLGLYFAFECKRPGMLCLGLGGLLWVENGLRFCLKVSVSRFWIALATLFLVAGGMALSLWQVAAPAAFLIAGALIIAKYGLLR